jgi:hypothetical protein
MKFFNIQKEKFLEFARNSERFRQLTSQKKAFLVHLHNHELMHNIIHYLYIHFSQLILFFWHLINLFHHFPLILDLSYSLYLSLARSISLLLHVPFIFSNKFFFQ